MNKTYRIIYNHHTGTYVAVAENTHARGKASRSGKVLSTVAVGAVLALSNVNALALESYGSGSGNPGVDGVSWGGGTTNCPAGVNTAWVEAEGGLAIGSDCSAQAMAMQKNAIAIGNGSTAGENAVALGRFANAAQANSVAVGYRAQALGIETVAIGHEAGINANGAYNTLIGKGAGENAVGDNNVMAGVTAGRDSVGSLNLMQGQQAGRASTGNLNVFLGVETGAESVGNNNSVVGYGAGKQAVGDSNALMGLGAGYQLQGANNTSLGSFAGANAIGDVNVMMGMEAGSNARSQYGIMLGAKAGEDSLGAGNIMLGSATGMASEGESNTIIGNSAGMGSKGNLNQISGKGAGVQLQGDYNIVSGTESGALALGNNNVFQGTGAGAVSQGNNNVFTGRFTGVGTTGNNNVAMGQLAGSLTYVDEATGLMQDRAGNSITVPINITVSNTVAIGNLALSESDRGTALGDNAYVSSALVGSVALGADSIANTAATPVTGFAGAAPVGVVSVGSVGKERQIQNVAAGQIGNLSTDAINGSQLYAVWQSANANAFHFVSINSNDASKGNYGNNGASGVNAVAIGVDTKATGLSSFAAGDNAFAQAKASVAIGQGAQALGNPSGGGSGFVDMGAVAIGYKAVSYDRGISIGNGAGSSTTHGSIAIGQDGDGSVAGYGIGTGALGSGYDRVAIGTETGIRNIGDRNVSIGGEVGNDVNGDDNVALGGLRTGINVIGNRNIAIGNLAGSGINASDTLSLGTSAKASRNDSIAMGNRAIASEANAISIGTGSQALGNRDVIIGSNTKGPANGISSSAAVGVGSNIQFVGAAVGRIEAVAVGEGVQVSDYGTGLGAQAIAGINSTAVGTYALAKGQGSIAIGAANNATGTKQTFADGADSIAIGNNSNTSSAATGSMALGVNASTTIANSVALGLGSIANVAAVPVVGFAGSAPVGVVSVGAVDKERQIQNVAAGQVSNLSTDAINGSQLYAVWQSANAAANSSNVHFVSINSVDSTKGNYGNDGAKGTEATAIGVNALAQGAYSTALGFSSDASGLNSIAIGDSLAAGVKSTGIGYNANAKGNNGVAVGVNVQTSGDNALAIGTGRNDINNQRTIAGSQSVALGYTARADATNAVAIGTYTAAGTDSIAMGNGADATQTNTIAIGKNAYAGVESINIGTSTVKGNDSNLTGAFRRGSTLIGNEAAGQGLYTTVIGNHSQVLANEKIMATGLFNRQFVAQNAFTNILGAYNTVGDTSTTKTYNGVAVTVVGAANKVKESNGALVAGYGNSVTNSYKDKIDVSGIVSSSIVDNTAAIADILNKSSTELGQTGVIGAVNKLDNSNNTLVMGMRNDVNLAAKSSVQGFSQIAQNINYTAISGADSRVENTSHVFSAGVNNSITNASDVIAMGNNMVVGSSTSTAKNSILLGNNIDFASNNNMANAVSIGDYSRANTGAVAVGVTAQALGVGSIAIGRDAIATGSVATGAGSRAGNGGSAYGDGAVATFLGGSNIAGTVAGTALGQNAKADVDAAVALGTNAVVTQANSVALGAYSTTSQATPTANTTINGVVYPFAGANPKSVVSVGSVGNERQIQNVAAGQIGSSSTDAINGSQLYASNTVINQNSTDITELQKGWTLASNNSAQTEQITAGETVNFNPGNNIAISQSGNAISIATTPNVAFDQVTVGGVVINNTTGINAGGLKITNVSNGALGSTSQDAVNGSQLYATNTNVTNLGNVVNQHSNTLAQHANTLAQHGTTINQNSTDITELQKGWTLASNNSAQTEQITAGETVNFNPGNNIAISQSGNAISIATTPNVAFDQMTVGGVVINKTTGINAGNTVISNVAAGSALTDAVNVSQLNKAMANTGGSWDLVVNNDPARSIGKGSVVEFKDGQNIAISQSGNAISIATTPNVAFDQVTVGGVVINNTTGINAGNTVISNVAAGSKGTDAVNVDQLDAVKNIAGSGWNVQTNGDKATQVKPGDTVDIGTATGESNIKVTRTGNVIDFELNKNLDLGSTGSVKMGDLTLNNSGLSIVNGPSITVNGIDAGSKTISNVAAGTKGTDAVNVDQLEAVKTTAGKGWMLQSDGDKATQVQPGDTVDIGVATGEKNITVSRNGNTVDFALNKNLDLGATGSIAIGDVLMNDKGFSINNGPSITVNGINAGNKTISNVAAATALTDAVNLSQLNQAIAGAKYAGLKVENGSDTILANESLNIVGQDGTTVTYDKNSNTYTVSSKQGGGTGTGTMNDWNVTGKDSSGGSVNVPITDGKNVAFAAGSKNVIVTPSQTADGAQVQVDIAKDLELNSVTTKNANGNSTVLNGDGVTAKNANSSSTIVNGSGVTIKGKDGKNGASITQAGIDAGNQTLKNVADGQNDTDAVNVRQLNQMGSTINNLGNRINEVEDNANAGTAAAMAMANLPQPANAGEGGMSLGLGTYQGESGYAVGYSAISENGNWIFKASATGNSQGKIGAGAGVFFKMH